MKRPALNVWPVFTDIMMGLVFILLLVAIVFMADRRDRIVNEEISKRKMALADELKRQDKSNSLTIKYADSTDMRHELLIRFTEEVLFEESKAKLKADSRVLLRHTGEILKSLYSDPNRRFHEIIVEGHTDDQPFQQEISSVGNWELSADRAIAVVQVFADDCGLPTVLLSPRGCADTRHPDTKSLLKEVQDDWTTFSDVMTIQKLWGEKTGSHRLLKCFADNPAIVEECRKLMRRVDIRVTYDGDIIWKHLEQQR